MSPDAVAQGDEAVCQSCGRQEMVAFYETAEVPVQSCVLLDTSAESEAFPVGEILLVWCEGCGFIQNERFDPVLVDYSMPTEESQAYSATFNVFASELADELVRLYGLKGKTVLEVGCGKGDFLGLLAERGIAHGYGIDPGFLPDRSTSTSTLEFARDWYGPEHTHLTADLVITRHLMEHIPNVAEFLGWLRTSVEGTEASSLFTEVPDVERVLLEGAFWDVYYEHCSYFTLCSLQRSLAGAGYEVEWLRTGFNDQYLLAGAVPSRSAGHDHPEWDADLMARLVEKFAVSANSQVARWRSKLGAVMADGGTVAVWGGGSKAVAFLSAVGVGGITVVDINPHKQGKWLPGVRVEVRSPEFLATQPPDLVVAMNPAYIDEISADLHRMGLYADLVSVHPR